MDRFHWILFKEHWFKQVMWTRLENSQRRYFIFFMIMIFWWSVIIVSFNFFPTSDLPKPSSSSDVMNSTCNVRYLEYFTFKIWVCGEVWTHFHNAILKTLWCVKFGVTELHPPVLTRVKEYNKSGHHRSALTQQVSIYSLNSLSPQNHIRTSRRADTRACFIFCQIVIKSLPVSCSNIPYNWTHALHKVPLNSCLHKCLGLWLLQVLTVWMQTPEPGQPASTCQVTGQSD